MDAGQAGRRWPVGERGRLDGLEAAALAWANRWWPAVAAVVVGVALGATTTLLTAALPLRYAIVLVGLAAGSLLLSVVRDIRPWLLAVVLLDIPFPFDIHLLYQEEVARYNALGGINISLSLVALCGLYALWLVRLLCRQAEAPGGFVRRLLPLGIYTGLVVLSIGWAADRLLASFEITLRVQLFLLFVYILGTVRTRQESLFILMVLFGGLLLESMVMVAVRAIGETITLGSLNARIDSSGRVGGTLGGPNSAAAYLTLLLTPALALQLTTAGRWWKRFALAALLAGALALLFTSSRGGWLACGLSMTVVCMAAWQRGLLQTRQVVIGLLVGLLALPSVGSIVLDRLRADDNGSAHSRLTMMDTAFEMIADHPLTGVGANNFVVHMEEYAGTRVMGLVWTSVVHNQFLLVWSEIGLFGLLAFVGFLAFTMVQSWRCWAKGDSICAPLALSMGAAILGHMVHMNFDLFNGRAHIQLLYTLSGLVVAMAAMESEAPDGPRADRARYT